MHDPEVPNLEFSSEGAGQSAEQLTAGPKSEVSSGAEKY